jgi:hypothetical protein
MNNYTGRLFSNLTKEQIFEEAERSFSRSFSRVDFCPSTGRLKMEVGIMSKMF